MVFSPAAAPCKYREAPPELAQLAEPAEEASFTSFIPRSVTRLFPPAHCRTGPASLEKPGRQNPSFFSNKGWLLKIKTKERKVFPLCLGGDALGLHPAWGRWRGREGGGGGGGAPAGWAGWKHGFGFRFWPSVNSKLIGLPLLNSHHRSEVKRCCFNSAGPPCERPDHIWLESHKPE